MRIALIMALLFFWLFLANRALQRGDMALAGVYAMVGVVLTVYRLSRKRPQSPSGT